MPVYEYQGKSYELETTDPAVAKQRIKKFLGEEEAAAEIPATSGNVRFGDEPARPKPPPRTFAPSTPESRTRALTDVINRGIIAGTLGAPVDIASLPFQLGAKIAGKEFPEVPFGSEYIGRKMEQAGMVSPTRRPLAEFAAGMAAPVAGAAAGLTKAGVGLAKQAIGKETRSAAEAAKRSAAQQYEPAITEAERGAEQAGRVIAQMERQPRVAEQRAVTAPLTPEQEVAALQAQVRQPVREKMAGQRYEARQRAAAAESEVKSAQEAAIQAQQVTAQAQQAVSALERSLVSRPTITAEQFGGELRNITKKLNDSLVSARAEQSGFNNVLAKFADAPVVDTSSLVSQAEKIASQSRNPTVISMMKEIQSLAKTDDANRLSLVSADSLRKTLHKDIINKYFPQTGADKEVLSQLRQLRGILIRQTPDEYKEALGKFATLSRPLDIMERQGALKRVLDVDPLSTAEKLTEAQVVGEIINKSRAGHPAFSRLLESSPQLKDSGRLYFTQNLFAKGDVPTEASLKTWLVTNERPLRQLGLYDEFRNIRTARETAQRSVDEAKLSEAAAKQTATAAQKAASAAEKQAAAATKVSEKSEKRLQEALGVVAPPTQRPGESMAEALRRTRTGEKAAPIQTFITKRQDQQKLAESLTKMRDETLAAKTPKEVKAAVEKAAKDLLDKGIIDNSGYRYMLRDVEKLESMIDAQARARKIIGYFAGISGVGYLGRRATESVFP